MAERRMFAKTIIDSDAFLDMPLSTQALYFHLSMRADDEGFINNQKKIQRMVGASDDDLKLLILKNFIIPFESGVVVIKHWKIHNYIRGDRKKATAYPEEMALLEEKENGAYTFRKDLPVIEVKTDEKITCLPSDSQVTVKCLSSDSQVPVKCQHRIGKDRIGKDRIGEDRGSCNEVVDLYHTICTSYPEVKVLSDARKKAIKARLNVYDLDDFKTVFEKAQASDFLKGANSKNWSATFDWMIKDANMAKILDGNYDGTKTKPQAQQGIKEHKDNLVDLLAGRAKEYKSWEE